MVDAIPRDDSHSLAFQLACLKEQAATASAQALRTRPMTRSVAWSPAGCSQTGGCLLAVTTDDGKVPVPSEPALSCPSAALAGRECVTFRIKSYHSAGKGVWASGWRSGHAVGDAGRSVGGAAQVPARARLASALDGPGSYPYLPSDPNEQQLPTAISHAHLGVVRSHGDQCQPAGV